MKALPLVFALATICLYAATLILLVHAKRKRSHCDPCIGTIIRLEESWDRHPSDHHHRRRITPILTYMVEGRVYEVAGNYYSTSMRVGKQLKLFYDREDPSKATTSGGAQLAALITGGLAVFFTCFTVVLFLFWNNLV